MKLLSRLFGPRVTTSLVTNATISAVTTNKLRSFTMNVLPKLARHDSMEGRDFIVVPMVMLTEGVHKGSEGPLYYPPEELSKTPVVWNHKPVVVYHPEINGQGVSACDPSILTNHKVGYVMNTQWEKGTGRLKAEAWIDPNRADEVDPRIMEAINKNTVMELSTGVFVDSEASPGKWNKEEYVGIARNYRPDHLAILPDKIGACSIKDGAGFLRNQSGDYSDKMDFSDGAQNLQGANGPRTGGRLTKMERARRKTAKVLQGDPSGYEPGVGGESSSPAANIEKGGYLVSGNDGDHLPTKTGGKPDHRLMGAAWAALHGGYRGNKYEGPGKAEALKKLKAIYKSEGMDTPTGNVEADTDSLLERIAKKMGILKNDEMPFDSIRTALSDAIREECGCEGAFYSGPSPWVVDVYSNFFVYEYNGSLWQCGYSASDDGVELDEEDPVEVERVPPQYRPVSSGGTNNEERKTKETMNKEQIVAQLIANSNGLLTEAERPRLLAMSEENLKRISFAPAPTANQNQVVTNADSKKTMQDDETDESDEEADPPPKSKKKPAKNEEPKVVTLQEYVNNAPKEIQEVLNEGVASFNQEKSRIIQGIVAVKNSGYTVEELNSKPLGELRKLARLAAVGSPEEAPRLLNYAGQSPVSMQSGAGDQEVLSLPTMNFEKVAVAK